MLKDYLTIIIPTHERHKLVFRSVDYFKQLNVQVIIADSSIEPLASELPQGFSYLHCPNDSFGAKLYKAIQSVKTPYACMCADDDFISEYGLSKGIEFLENNSDYVSVQGQCINFNFKNGRVSNHPIYTRVLGYTVSNESRLDRIKKAFKPYMHHFYSVHRTQIIKKSLKVVSTLKAITVAEIAVPLVGVTYGKHIMLPVFWAARDTKTYTFNYVSSTSRSGDEDEVSDNVKQNSIVVKDWLSYLKSEDGCLFKNNYCDEISDVVECESECVALFDAAFSAYMSGFPNKESDVKVSFKSKIRKTLPRSILNIYLLIRYSRFMYRNHSGYPWSNAVSAKDWDVMKDVIVEHGDVVNTG